MPDLGDPHRRRFDPATAVQLFKRFYRSDTSRTASSTGSAIGLTIAKAMGWGSRPDLDTAKAVATLSADRSGRRREMRGLC